MRNEDASSDVSEGRRLEGVAPVQTTGSLFFSVELEAVYLSLPSSSSLSQLPDLFQQKLSKRKEQKKMQTRAQRGRKRKDKDCKVPLDVRSGGGGGGVLRPCGSRHAEKNAVPPSICCCCKPLIMFLAPHFKRSFLFLVGNDDAVSSADWQQQQQQLKEKTCNRCCNDGSCSR